MKLADYLAKHGLSHSDFAAKISVSQASVTRYVQGQRTPRPAHMRRIREVTRGAVTANDFIGTSQDNTGHGAAA
ncbi:helix-turn-helix domain-containing protein [Alsobacter sp. KACC 23698]|uniref:helix-turn-helix domain-containing protein n=1 Tax=Alsobacter sp. KACC 23698 TaxID=3149229 RepID=UPI003878438E